MESNTTLEDLFSCEVLRWRYFKALVTSLSLHLVISNLICNIIKTLLYEVVLNPLTWLHYIVNGIIQPFWLFRIIIPAFCYIIITRVHVHSYTVTWWIPEKRLQYFSHFLEIKKIISSLLFILVTVAILLHSVSLVHPDLTSVTITCTEKENVCVNHQALLILLCGVLFGCRLSLKYFLHNFRTIRFPVAELNLLVQIKGKLQLKTFIEACSLYDIRFSFFASVFLAYFLSGGMLSQWISPFLGISYDEEASSMWPVVAMIFDTRFIFTLIVCMTLLAYNVHCFFLIFQDIVLKRIELPLNCEEHHTLNSENRSQPVWTLSNCLVSSCSLLKLMSFKHLRDFSNDQTKWGMDYRSQIFTISQPGGHPRNWQGVVIPSLNLIRKFTERLRLQNCLTEKTTVRTSADGFLSHKTDVNKNQLVVESRFNLKHKWDQMKEGVKQLPVIWYLLSDIPDSNNRQIFAEGQAVIWAVEGLSNLVATSFTDDQFGVVQRNISDILSVLVELQLIMEKVGRGLPYRRITQGTNFGNKIQKYPHDLQFRRALRVTLRSSLYIITNVFKESIREIDISQEVKNKLDMYLTFQEG